MISSVQRWVLEGYMRLWARKRTDKFTFEQAAKILEYNIINDTEKKKNTKLLSETLNELKKSEWLDVELNKSDSRKRSYKLRPFDEIADAYSKSK